MQCFLLNKRAKIAITLADYFTELTSYSKFQSRYDFVAVNPFDRKR